MSTEEGKAAASEAGPAGEAAAAASEASEAAIDAGASAVDETESVAGASIVTVDAPEAPQCQGPAAAAVRKRIAMAMRASTAVTTSDNMDDARKKCRLVQKHLDEALGMLDRMAAASSSSSDDG